MNTKILASLLVIGLTAIAIGGAYTGAFFSDEEISAGNTFAAGALDLEIDSTCHYNGMSCVDGVWTGDETIYTAGVLGTTCACTWGFQEWDGQTFFRFNDIKPGDFGENTLSFHLDNEAWACIYVDNYFDRDNGCTEPEVEVDETCDDVEAGEGELAENLEIFMWIDDLEVVDDPETQEDETVVKCDNVWQADEQIITDWASIAQFETAVGGAVIPVADATNSLLGDYLPRGDYCVGLAWMVDGDVKNIIQTDSVGGDVRFYVEQARNNPDFECDPVEEEEPGEPE